jgi:hypothetical protein
MKLVHPILMIAAVLCFLLSALDVSRPKWDRESWLALGLALWAVATILPATP